MLKAVSKQNLLAGDITSLFPDGSADKFTQRWSHWSSAIIFKDAHIRKASKKIIKKKQKQKEKEKRKSYSSFKWKNQGNIFKVEILYNFNNLFQYKS